MGTLALLLVAAFAAACARNNESARLEPMPTKQVIHGISVADMSNAGSVVELGLPWIKGYIAWERIESERGAYDWTDLDEAIRIASENGLALLLRVDRAPAWSHPSNPSPLAPPDPEYFGDWSAFLRQLAERGEGRVEAYEIWNEPNLALEWGGKPPDPAGYRVLLQAAYQAIKAGDDEALVVSAGLASTEEDSERAMDNVAFLRGLYEEGTAPYFDVMGSHPAGGPHGPSGGRFLRAEEERRVMEKYGDMGKPAWATELAWLLQPPSGCRAEPEWQSRLWESVSAESQAGYAVQSLETIQARWPWITGVFLFNLDFSMAPWYGECEPMAYESLLGRDGLPRLAFWAVREWMRNGRGAP